MAKAFKERVKEIGAVIPSQTTRHTGSPTTISHTEHSSMRSLSNQLFRITGAFCMVTVGYTVGYRCVMGSVTQSNTMALRQFIEK